MLLQGTRDASSSYKRAAAVGAARCILATQSTTVVRHPEGASAFDEAAAYLHGRSLQSNVLPMRLMQQQDLRLSSNNAERAAFLLRQGMNSFRKFSNESEVINITAAAESLRSKVVASSIIATLQNIEVYSISGGSNRTALGLADASWHCAGGGLHSMNQPQAFFVTDVLRQASTSEPPANLACDVLQSIAPVIKAIPLEHDCDTQTEAGDSACEVPNSFLQRQASMTC